jgi:hypothetical protein
MVALLGLVAILVGFIAPAAATPPGDNGHKVTICHRTNSVTNPYTVNTVDLASVDGDAGNDHGQGDHYLNHVGPLFDPEAEYSPPMKGDEWGDIIPPVPDVHEGLNWSTAGQAIWENGCNLVVPTRTEPTTETPTTEPSTETPTTEPTTETPTTEPTTETPTTEPSTGATETPSTGATDTPSTGATTTPEEPETGATVPEATTPAAEVTPEGGALTENAVPRAATDGADLVGAGWTPLQSLLTGSELLLLLASGLMSARRLEGQPEG